MPGESAPLESMMEKQRSGNEYNVGPLGCKICQPFSGQNRGKARKRPTLDIPPLEVTLAVYLTDLGAKPRECGGLQEPHPDCHSPHTHRKIDNCSGKKTGRKMEDFFLSLRDLFFFVFGFPFFGTSLCVSTKSTTPTLRDAPS